MNERASERASISVNEARPCSRCQAIPCLQRPQPMCDLVDDWMTHSTKARSIVEDSISIKGGIFYPTAVWEKKEGKKIHPARSQRCWKEEDRCYGKRKNNFKRKFMINGPGLSENRTTLLEVSCAPNFHSPFLLHQGEAMNVPFGSVFIMNVH